MLLGGKVGRGRLFVQSRSYISITLLTLNVQNELTAIFCLPLILLHAYLPGQLIDQLCLRDVNVFRMRDMADVRAINAVVVLVNYVLGNVSTL